jgi:hypothetical protein
MMRLALALAALALPVALQAQTAPPEPRHFLFLGGSPVEEAGPVLADPALEGVQIVYNWRQLEPGEGVYDFSRIERDLAGAQARGKVLWVQLQDRFFRPQDRLVPDYILNEPIYGGGLARQFDNPGEGREPGSGWTAMQWNPHVRSRFQALITALAQAFDGRIAGINLPETAFDPMDDSDGGFACDAYFAAELENTLHARRQFARTPVVRYVNFFPCEWNNDRRYMERFFDAAVSHGIGLGGPDIVPWRQGQMRNSYPFFHRLNRQLPLVAMAVQEPTLTYTDPATGKGFTRQDFITFGRDYLGVDIIFWSASAPWLTDPAKAQASQ